MPACWPTRSANSHKRFCIISFTSDWLFPTVENKRIAHALNAAAAKVSFVEIETDKGHDAFLLDEPEMFDTVRGFLNAVAAADGWHEQRLPIFAPDLAAIAEMIPMARACWMSAAATARCWNIWCATKNVDGRGIELSQQNVNACVARGLAVVQGDADTDLAEYPAQVFDLVILSQTIQATRKARPGAGASAAHRPARGDFPAQFRALAGAAGVAVRRAHAAHPGAGL